MEIFGPKIGSGGRLRPPVQRVQHKNLAFLVSWYDCDKKVEWRLRMGWIITSPCPEVTLDTFGFSVDAHLGARRAVFWHLALFGANYALFWSDMYRIHAIFYYCMVLHYISFDCMVHFFYLMLVHGIAFCIALYCIVLHCMHGGRFLLRML